MMTIWLILSRHIRTKELYELNSLFDKFGRIKCKIICLTSASVGAEMVCTGFSSFSVFAV